ncbi:amidohydrolase [Lentibacillus sp. CBA3610]|uniref:amidohydrolase n=1 Tax=Lentibacillus sp. CBA3610 TaxID=2518176 RepID=UPI0015956115|nr:amidohydrolase [Lentibacillus sp. CBA3610]QKY70125.1 amidohydrolase [Lentibacillus sp. CBA3610]
MSKENLLITNANILTLDDENRRAGSLAVTNGYISRIWFTPEPPRESFSYSPETEVVNLRGATLIPGFIDTHNHILMYSLNKDKVDCSTPPNKNINDILEKVNLKAKETPKEEWVQGYGYDDSLLGEKRHPTKGELDKAAPDHPVFITHISSHFAVANSKALEVAGIDEDVTDPQGSHFGRDHAGRLDGVLHEIPAMNYVQRAIPLPTTKEMVHALEKGAQDYLAQGITTNTDAGVGLFFGETGFDAHIIASNKGINPMRSQLMMMHTLLQENGKFRHYSVDQLNNEIMKTTNGNVRLDSAKMFQDGSIQGLTGALRQPYYNNPHVSGELLHDQRAFNDKILDLHKRGFRIAIHGNGDRAIGSILEGFANALKQSPRSDHRHRIEHVQTATSDDLDTMQKLGIAGSVFINHVYYWGDRHNNLFLGPDRAVRISPLADMMERGLLYTLHSDCPVTPISPLFSVWAAVNRLTSNGEILGPGQRIDVSTALKAMTSYGAKLNFSEDRSGSIEIGKQADFAVLEDDPTQVAPIEIKDIPVQTTVIGGKAVYEASKGTLQN